MPGIELRDVRNFACKGVDLEVRPGELLVLLGPNGAGKTTLLNVIAGLVEYQGTVTFDGSPIDRLPPRRRGVGYLFQNPALFPHLDVQSNIAFGLEGNGRCKTEIAERVTEMLDLLAIRHLSARYPATLSGGERQRAALARALAPQPGILLLDEPFNSLDPQTRDHLSMELEFLHRNLGVTTVLVTHDLEEAERIADRVAVVLDGTVRQTGTVADVLLAPRERRVTEFLGSPNVFECTTMRHLGYGLIEADCAGLRLVAPHNGNGVGRVAIAARDVRIRLRAPASQVNVFPGIIERTTTKPGVVLALVDVRGTRISAEVPQPLFDSLRLEAGSRVLVELSLMKIRTGA